MCKYCDDGLGASKNCRCLCADDTIYYDKYGGDLFYCEGCAHHINTKSPNLRRYNEQVMPDRVYRAPLGFVYYFAYGSNLDTEQMKTRVGEWKELKKGRLDGYRLAFDKHSSTWKGGVADIVKESKSAVYGAVYLLTSDQFKELSKYEVGYAQLDVTVDTPAKIAAKTYEVVRKEGFVKPTKFYVDKIVKGLINIGYAGGSNQIVVKEIIRIAQLESEYGLLH